MSITTYTLLSSHSADTVQEVERARKLIADSLTGYKIVHVDAQEDKIVYTGGTDHTEFVRFFIVTRTISSVVLGQGITGSNDRGM